MNRLEGTTVEELQRALDEVEGKKPTQRLVVAIAYKNGVAQTELAEWFDVERKTIYNWLTRLEETPIEEAAVDTRKTGGKWKLSEEQIEEFEETVTGSPRDVGYNEPAWTTELVRRHLTEPYNVQYLGPSCRRLLKQAGLQYRRAGPSDGSADRDEVERSAGGPGNGGRWIPQ